MIPFNGSIDPQEFHVNSAHHQYQYKVQNKIKGKLS